MSLRLDDVIEHASTEYERYGRAYYLRTRKLKGRQGGSSKSEPSRSRGQSTGSKRTTSKQMYTVRTGSKVERLNTQQLKAKQAYAAQRVTEIRKKLDGLNAKLRERMAEAKATDRKKNKAPTAADKSKKAREAKQYRAKNQQKLATKSKKAAKAKSSAKPKKDSVETLSDKITEVRSSLQKAVKRQRALATAKKSG